MESSDKTPQPVASEESVTSGSEHGDAGDVGSSETGLRFRDVVLWGLLIGVVLVLLAVSLHRWATGGVRAADLPILGKVPELSLTNHDGRTVTDRDFLGAPWIADFMFTRCVAICPLMSAQMQHLDETLSKDPLVRLVSFTVDPEHDDVAVLDGYAKRLEASERWFFLTGDKQELYDLSFHGFKLAVGPAEDQAEADPIVHSTRFVLVDAEGRIRGYYDAFDPAELERLHRELAALL
jgi:protein SCO1